MGGMTIGAFEPTHLATLLRGGQRLEWYLREEGDDYVDHEGRVVFRRTSEPDPLGEDGPGVEWADAFGARPRGDLRFGKLRSDWREVQAAERERERRAQVPPAPPREDFELALKVGQEAADKSLKGVALALREALGRESTTNELTWAYRGAGLLP